jgi:predicted metal-dependent phosphoesterase TrpH
MIDLHVHTTASDGTYTPADVVRYAAQKGVTALAITDHDTVAGVSLALDQAPAAGVEVVPGVEVSAQWESGIMHILGYFLKIDQEEFLGKLARLKQARDERTPKILAKLRDLNVDVSVEEVNEAARGGVPGRPHIARVMTQKRYVAGLQEAFDLFLKKGGAAYVEKFKLPPEEALELILRAGGLPVLAHPYSLLEEMEHDELEETLRWLVSLGLGGIEVYYPVHSEDQTRLFLEFARRFDLAITGGTDFHGANKPEVEIGVIPGQPPLSYTMLQDLKKRNSGIMGTPYLIPRELSKVSP